MFSGIIEDLGVIKKVESGKLTVETKLTDLSISDSIAVNGVCLTLSKIFSVTEGWTIFTADVAEETLKRTNLGMLKVRNKINLERSLKLGGRFGGHIVTGHINGIGQIKSIKDRRHSQIFEIMVSRNMLRYLVAKGSVAVDGVSLTVVDVFANKPRNRQFPAVFTVSMITHTSKNTTFSFKTTGDPVNVEVDILSKYVENILESKNESKISKKFLEDKGFI